MCRRLINSQDGFKASYTVGKKIGEGGFSIVKKVALKRNLDQTFAAKIIPKRGTSKTAFQEEIKILKRLNHPNIIKFHEFHQGNDQYYLVTELMTGGTLSDHLASKTSTFSEKDVRFIMKTLFDAISYCHGRNIVHRDVKPENILLLNKENKRLVKIADFGFAKKIRIAEDSLLTLCGTPKYIAPEVLNGNPYGAKVDMWSLGVVAYMLLTGHYPFSGKHIEEMKYDIIRGRYKSNTAYWKAISPGAKNVVTSLIVVNSSSRLAAKEAIRLPWITEIDMASKRRNQVEAPYVETKKLRHAVFSVMATNKLLSII